jgi:flagellar biosynthetic protein FliQ
MGSAETGAILTAALLLALKLAGPLLAASLVVGLAISLVQAITQLNEATLSFVPKLIALGATLLFLGPFMLAAVDSYARLLFSRIVALGAS